MAERSGGAGRAGSTERIALNSSDHAGGPPGEPGRRAGAAASPGGQKAGAWAVATILLAVAVAGSLIVPIYARTTPMLGDFPFFYWYQLLLVPVVAVISWLAYLLVRRRPGGRR